MYLEHLHLFYKIDKLKLKNILYGIFFSFLAIIWIVFLNFIRYRCFIHKYLHLWCPGCGATRMIISILNLDFYQAFRYNPLIFLLFIVAIIYIILSIFIYIKKKVLYIPSTKFWIILLVLLIIYMIFRNIDYFSYLIPTEV